jgi:hypothetical protein
MNQIGPERFAAPARLRRSRSAVACLLPTVTAGALIAVPLSPVARAGNRPAVLAQRAVVTATYTAPLVVAFPMNHWMETHPELSAVSASCRWTSRGLGHSRLRVVPRCDLSCPTFVTSLNNPA